MIFSFNCILNILWLNSNLHFIKIIGYLNVFMISLYITFHIFIYQTTSKNPCGGKQCTCRKYGMPCLRFCGECRGTECTNSKVNHGLHFFPMNSILWWLTLTLKTSVFVYLKDIDDEANRVELEAVSYTHLTLPTKA